MASSFPQLPVLLGTLAFTLSLQAGPRLTLDAGPHPRSQTPVRFTPPSAGPWELLDSKGVVHAVQSDLDGSAWFLLPELPAGSQATYELHRAKTRSSRVPNQAVTESSRAGVEVVSHHRPVFTYNTVPAPLPPGRPDLTPVFQRGGYLHPVFTPAGRVVTDDYPANHRHHHGIWFAWTKTGFEGRSPDFWNMGDRKGTVEFVGLDRTWNGPVHAGFQSRHQQVDLTSGSPRIALRETWNVRAFALGSTSAVHLFDIEITDVCATNTPLDLPQYRYGGIGVRGHAAWNDPSKMGFLNSGGVTDRSKGDKGETVGDWAVLHGPVDGGYGGIALFGHPGNANAPQPQRIHPTEPFLCFAPQQAGPLRIEPGKPFIARYRFATFDGPPDARLLERLWNDYAHPPVVQLLP